MKQAILITAYKNMLHLRHLIEQFDDDFSFYIHIDSKSLLNEVELEAIHKNKKVRLVSRKYNVNWASVNHLKCILDLAREATKDAEIEYIHLISGQDFPAKNCANIKAFLQINRGNEYLRYFEIPVSFWAVQDGGYDRLRYYYFYDYFNHKTTFGALLNHVFLFVQKLVKIKRSMIRLPKLYGGSTWWTLSSQCVKYVVEYTNSNPIFWKRFSHTCCPEEIYIPTIIMNSPFAKKVVNNDLRFISWEFRNGSFPANLDEEDYIKIKSSEKLFVRKCEYPISESLLNYLQSDKKSALKSHKI